MPRRAPWIPRGFQVMSLEVGEQGVLPVQLRFPAALAEPMVFLHAGVVKSSCVRSHLAADNIRLSTMERLKPQPSILNGAIHSVWPVGVCPFNCGEDIGAVACKA